MENEITAHKAGKVEQLPISEGAAVDGRRHAGRHQMKQSSTRSSTRRRTGCGSRRSRPGSATPRSCARPPSGRSRASSRPAARASSSDRRRHPLVVGELRAAARTRRRCSSTATTTSRPRRRARGPRRRSSPRSATAASTRAARPTTRATSCRCSTSPARWPRRRAAGPRPRARRGRGGAGPDAVGDWVRADERGADCAIVFDSGHGRDRHARDHGRPARHGVARLEVRTAERDAALGRLRRRALNAFHVLHAMLAAVLPGADGRLPRGAARRRRAARAGGAASWARCRRRRQLAAAGARPADAGRGDEY